ncbi:MAG: sodium:solute symporter [Bacteriovoracaceae bacterium]|nr:sodium:solute symporter [Bacteriovoracaceae bacterium]
MVEGQMAAWISIILFGITFLGIAIYASRKTKNAKSFAIGDGAGPLAVGMSLATTLTSAAVFIINPGLVYYYGISVLISFCFAANFGIILGLLVLVRGFRKAGISGGLVSVPSWIEKHYGGGLPVRLFYAVSSLLLITYMVLIFVGLTNILTQLLGISAPVALFMLIAFIILYNQIGGANSHVYTNFLQGIVMVVVAIILIGSGFHLFEGGLLAFFTKLREIDSILVQTYNPKSIMFRDFFEVVACNIVIGFAIVCQPHILSKGLFLKNDRDVNKFMLYAMAIGTIFSMVMVVGLYARLTLSAGILPDKVVSTYIVQNFATPLKIIISLGFLCAGISTLEAILLSLSVTFSFDMILPVMQRKFNKHTDPEKMDLKNILNYGKMLTVVSGVFVYFLSLQQIENPSVSVAVFAFNGVYALFAITFIPVAAKIFKLKLGPKMILATSVLIAVIHFGMRYGKVAVPGLNPWYWTNPGVTATLALFVACLVVAFYLMINKLMVRSPRKASDMV